MLLEPGCTTETDSLKDEVIMDIDWKKIQTSEAMRHLIALSLASLLVLCISKVHFHVIATV